MFLTRRSYLQHSISFSGSSKEAAVTGHLLRKRNLVVIKKTIPLYNLSSSGIDLEYIVLAVQQKKNTPRVNRKIRYYYLK